MADVNSRKALDAVISARLSIHTRSLRTPLFKRRVKERPRRAPRSPISRCHRIVGARLRRRHVQTEDVDGCLQRVERWCHKELRGEAVGRRVETRLLAGSKAAASSRRFSARRRGAVPQSATSPGSFRRRDSSPCGSLSRATTETKAGHFDNLRAAASRSQFCGSSADRRGVSPTLTSVTWSALSMRRHHDRKRAARPGSSIRVIGSTSFSGNTSMLRPNAPSTRVRDSINSPAPRISM